MTDSSAPFTYRWASKGDLNAFFALMFDNMLNLVILTAILVGVGFALLPSIGELVRIIVTGQLHVDAAMLSALLDVFHAEALNAFSIITLIGHGFILTAMLWGTAFAQMIDGRTGRSALHFLLCALFTSFGLIHSASPAGGLYLPWRAPEAAVYRIGIGCVLMAATLLLLDLPRRKDAPAGPPREVFDAFTGIPEDGPAEGRR